VIASYDDLLQVLYEIKGQENEIRTRSIEELTKGLVGWPGFQEVFTTSALNGDGIDDLRGYILEKAYPSYGSWDYNEKLLTNKVKYKINMIIINRFNVDFYMLICRSLIEILILILNCRILESL